MTTWHLDPNEVTGLSNNASGLTPPYCMFSMVCHTKITNYETKAKFNTNLPMRQRG